MAKSKRSRKPQKKATIRKSPTKRRVNKTARWPLKHKAVPKRRAPPRKRGQSKSKQAHKKKLVPVAVFSWSDTEEE